MTKFFSILLYLILIITLLAKEPKPQYFVDAKGGLHLREEPSEKSKSILLIPDKSGIQILKEVGDAVKLNEKKGRWTEIQFGNKRGYAFGAYIGEFFLLNKKFSPNKNLYYEYYTPSLNTYCSNDPNSELSNQCFMKIYRSKDRKLVKLLNNNDTYDKNSPLGDWFNVVGWFDNKSLFITDSNGDGGVNETSIGYIDINTGVYHSILYNVFSNCNDEKSSIEQIEFNKTEYYAVHSENPKLRTGYFTMLKQKADDYDKLLETCKRDLKNSVLVKPTTIVRKNYTFKINSKRASLFFKGKDILKLDE